VQTLSASGDFVPTPLTRASPMHPSGGLSCPRPPGFLPVRETNLKARALSWTRLPGLTGVQIQAQPVTSWSTARTVLSHRDRP